ncbi:MAG: dihydropteroate synthase [Pseudomonadota bacterium]|jgi:dihydropteroate synthase
MPGPLTLLSDLVAVEPRDLFLRPLTVLAPGARATARVAGGLVGFDTIEVMVRKPGGIERAIAPINDLQLWTRHQGREIARHADAVLDRITRPREAFAGVAMDRPRIMGILNVTPDSFSDGGLHASPEAAARHALDLMRAGAAFLDVGGESTRPGSDPVDPHEERRRVLPIIKALHESRFSAVLSIDTRKAGVMEDAVRAGAGMVNDISALTYDEQSLATVARLGVPVVLMHCQGDPKTMQDKPRYGHAPTEIFDYLAARIVACENAGIPRSRIAVDPGIGFGKGLAHNLAVLADLALFHGLGCPVLAGVSRKSFIGHLAGIAHPRERMPGSLAAMLWAVGQGVQIVRVHDVAETAQALAVWQGVAGAEG